LKCVVIDEGLLQWMQGPVGGEPLDSCDMSAVLHDRESKTGVDPPTLDQDRACAALPVIAALLCSGQTETIAERIQ
jgi:hypothetical protein